MIEINNYDFKTPTLFCETENGQIFSNGKTSLFYLNKKVFDTNILNYNKLEKKERSSYSATRRFQSIFRKDKTI